MSVKLSDSVQSAINKLESAGYLVYVSGRTMRELLMDEAPVSYILVTDAPREEINRIFKKTIDGTKKRKLVTVIDNKTAFDIYYPSENSGNDKIRELLFGFDFTINSIAYNPKTGILDYFGGIKDLEDKKIRFTDESQNMITERPARMLRALRYSAQLGFEVDEDCAQLIKKCSMLIKRASADIIREELDKILMSQNPGVFLDIHKLGLLRYILPELDVCFFAPQKNKYHIYNVGEHIVNAVMNSHNDPVVRWAALLHDIGKPECKSVDVNGIIHFYGHHRVSVRLAGDILRRLKIDSSLSRDILILIENHDVRIDATPLGVKRMMSRTGADNFEKLLELQEADNRAKNMKYFPDKLIKLNDVRKMYRKILAERHPYRVNDLAVTGRDLNKLGFRPGHEISDALQALLEEVFLDPGLNNRDYLMLKAKLYKKKKNKPNNKPGNRS